MLYERAPGCKGYADLLEINASLVAGKELQIVLYVLGTAGNPDRSLIVFDNSLLTSGYTGGERLNLVEIRSLALRFTEDHKSAVFRFCGDLDFCIPPGTEIASHISFVVAEIRGVETAQSPIKDLYCLCRGVEVK